jgi:hypothetical protein
MRAPDALAVLLICGPGFAADATFEGFARAPDSNALLYVESHFVWDAGAADESRIVLYRCPRDGQPFARKELSYAQVRNAPSFDFQDARSGFAEGLGRKTGVAVAYARAGSSAPRRDAAVTDPKLIADAGFDEFVRANWATLQKGTAITAPFLVPSLLDSVDFRVRKKSGTNVDGAESSVIRLSVAGPQGWLLSDIDVTYRNEDRRLLSYRGVTNIRDADGKMLTARIDFPDDVRRDAAPDAARLRAMPLVKGCD